MYEAVIFSDTHMEFMSVNIADGIEHKMKMWMLRIFMKCIDDLKFFSNEIADRLSYLSEHVQMIGLVLLKGNNKVM